MNLYFFFGGWVEGGGGLMDHHQKKNYGKLQHCVAQDAKFPSFFFIG
jgi:hypothetical protein